MTEKVRDLMAALEASLARIKEEQAERAIGDGQSDDSPSTDTQAIGPDTSRSRNGSPEAGA